MAQGIMVSTTFQVDGFRVVRNLGVVRGVTVRTRGLGGKISAGLRGLVGGKVDAYVSMCEVARAEAMEIMLTHAQEKGATKLLQLSAPQVTPVAIASEYKPMSCANCKDSFVAVPDTEIKGAGARALVSSGTPTRIVAKHLCGTCANKWVVKGHGKAKVSVPVHQCASCG